MIGRRRFLAFNTFLAGSAFWSAGKATAQPEGSPPSLPVSSDTGRKADYTLFIEEGKLEPKDGHIINTFMYNGLTPGPLLRMSEGKEVVVDIHNRTSHPEMLHWHGLILPGSIDGSLEEGTAFISPATQVRQVFTPTVSGLRAYHTHVRAGKDTSLGLYSGLVGPVYIEPKNNLGHYDQEVFLTLKEYSPSFSANKMDDGDFLEPDTVDTLLKEELEKKEAENKAKKLPEDLDLVYEYYTVNGRCLGYGEPVKARPGQRILFHILNASATETRSIALPRHLFKVVALDGNPVPVQAKVPVLWLGALERVSAIVEMVHPGIWIMGDVNEQARKKGMGVVVEYANASGVALWEDPTKKKWDYRIFAAHGRFVPQPDHVFEFHISEHHNPDLAVNVNLWTLNGKAFNMKSREGYYNIEYGKRYRVRFYNPTDEAHPLHLHRHSFEVVNIAGSSISGLIKDVVMIGSCQTLEFDFIANQKGASLFHCHMQHHMDYGFMAVFECI